MKMMVARLAARGFNSATPQFGRTTALPLHRVFAQRLGGLLIWYPTTASMMRSIHNIAPNQPFVYGDDASGISSLTGT